MQPRALLFARMHAAKMLDYPLLAQSRMTTRPEDFVSTLAETFPHLKVCILFSMHI